MNPLKHKLANEWMRQDDASPQEALDTWNTMEAEFKLNRAALEEPRTMAQGGGIIGKPGGLVEPGVMYYGKKVKDMTSEERFLQNAQKGARNKGISGKQGSPEFEEFLKTYRTKEHQKKEWGQMRQKKLLAHQEKFNPEKIKLQTTTLTQGQKNKLYKTYDSLFKEEYKRLLAGEDLFSKSDLIRSVITRIEKENPTINLLEGKGLDKIPGGGNEQSKTMFEILEGRHRDKPLFSEKEMSKFTTNTNALKNTKTQEKIFNLILDGTNNKKTLIKKLGISEGRLDYNVEKLMKNLSKGSRDRYLFLKKFKDKDLEKVRNNIFESPTLEDSWRRTISQSILQSTKFGSSERRQAFAKLKEFNIFRQAMADNGLDPKLIVLDHAASYRAIKNGQIREFLSVTPVMKDINTVKSGFDKRSQQNLRRMKDYLMKGDDKMYRYYLKNQMQLENIWGTMTGGQSSLGKIRVTTTGPHKGKLKIYDYGATSLLDKNKDLVKEIGDNLNIRKNIVKASTKGNLQEVNRIMMEGSTPFERKLIGEARYYDRRKRTSLIPEAFKRLDKPEMFKAEKQIGKILSNYWCGKKAAAEGGRISFATGSGCPDSVKRKNFLVLNNDVRAGKITGEAAEQIAKQTSKVVAKAGSKSALASIFGPYGIGIDVIYEVGAVGIDMYAGKPWKEAVQDNWIAGAFMPGTSQEEFHKRLFEEYPVGYEGEKTKKYPEAKPYGSGLDLKEAYDKKQKQIDRLKAETTYRGKAEAERQLPGLERDLRGIAAQYNALGSIMEEGSPEYENYMAAVTEARDADKAKSKATKAKLKMELDRPTSDRAVPYKRGEPVKIDFKLPKPVEISKTPLNADQLQEYAEYHRNVGDLEPRGELPQWYVDEIQNKEKWRQLFEQRGIRGSQDWKGATGGIASLKKKW